MGLNMFRLALLVCGFTLSLTACREAAQSNIATDVSDGRAVSAASASNAETVVAQQDGDANDNRATRDNAVNGDEVHYIMLEPEGWRSERVALPLPFAPAMSVSGHKDVRFRAGMFEDGAEDYWSYAFLWWLDDDAEITKSILKSNLEAYLTGLAHVVDRDGDRGAHQASFRFLETSDLSEPLQGLQAHMPPAWIYGEAEVFDGFVKKEKIGLYFIAHDILCEAQGKRALFFTLSPQDYSSDLWSEFLSVRRGFSCDKI